MRGFPPDSFLMERQHSWVPEALLVWGLAVAALANCAGCSTSGIPFLSSPSTNNTTGHPLDQPAFSPESFAAKGDGSVDGSKSAASAADSKVVQASYVDNAPVVNLIPQSGATRRNACFRRAASSPQRDPG